MTHDVFISYPSLNKPIADAICAKLESHNYRCWFAPRDILPGQPYPQALLDAIDSSKIFILVFSAETNNSPHIMSEVREAFNQNLIIIPFRIDNILPSRELEFFIGSPHWLDAMTPPLEKHIDELVKVVQKNLGLRILPTAKFSSDVTSGKAPLTVKFIDESSGNPTQFFWDFGDGTTSPEKNPSHTYDKTGDFTVSLTVTNREGLSNNSISHFIHAISRIPEPTSKSEKPAVENKNLNAGLVLLIGIISLIILGFFLISFTQNAGKIPAVPPTTYSSNLSRTINPPSTSLPTITALIPSRGVWVNVIYPNKFSGTISTPGWRKDVADIGNQFYQIPTTDGPVVISIQKLDGSSAELTVDVYKDGTLMNHAATTAPMGIVEV